MKTKSLTHIVGLLLLTAIVVQKVCGSDVFSVYPITSECDAILIPGVDGSWEISSFEPDTLEVRRAGDNFYSMILKSGGRSSEFEATFTLIGKELMLDLLPKTAISHNFIEEYYQNYLLSLHSFIRVQLTEDTLRLAFPNYRWYYDNVIVEQSGVSYLLSDSRLILNLPTNVLRAYLQEHKGDTGFFEDDAVARRIAGEPHSQREVGHKRDGEDQQTALQNDLLDLQLQCTPSFPYTNGWLGGDGGLAAPIGPSKTVWLFGDTYVGRKNQKTRQGANMVTTIGVSTCEANGEIDMQYYWSDMYTDHPDHFFQSHTNRYKFWPLDGFMYDGNLFVLLQKTGPLAGSSPDDIFNFSALGYTLAKVADPAAGSPSDWQIDLFPWSQAVGAGQYQGGFAKDEEFAYLFMTEEGKQNFLVRLPLSKLESPEQNMEYFSKDELWKSGIESSDAKVLFQDPLIGRANYIPELKEWLVVYGPYYGGDEIYFRTAPKIVGRWSDRRVLYKCPELVQGTPRYDKDNFCYCSRVLSTSFEKGTFRLLLTYTCNSNEQSKVTENMAIYSPQVVEVALPK